MAIVVLVTGCIANMADPIVGTWNRTDPPDSNTYVFNPDGTCDLLSGDKVIISGNWKRTADGEYEVNYFGNRQRITMNREKSEIKDIYAYVKVKV